MTEERYSPMLRLRLVLTLGTTDAVELITALTTLGYGLWLLNPFLNTFGSPAWAGLRGAVTDDEAGTAFAVIGALRLWAYLWGHDVWRRKLLPVCLFLWSLLLFVLLINNNTASLIGVIVCAQVLPLIWVYLRMTGKIQRPKLGIIDPDVDAWIKPSG